MRKVVQKVYALFLMWIGNYLACGFSLWSLVLGSSGYALILHSGSKL